MAFFTKKQDGMIQTVLSKLDATGFFSIVGTSLLNKVIQFISGMILVRILSKSEYGAYSYGFNIINYFILFNGLGTSSCVVQFCVEQKTEEMAEEVYRVICRIGLLWDVLLTIVIICVGIFVQLPMDGANIIVLYLALFPIYSLFVELQQQRLRAQFRTRHYAWATNINSVLVVILSVAGAACASSTGLSIGRTLAMALTVLVVYSLFRVEVFAKPRRFAKSLVIDIVKMSTTVCLTNAVSQALILVGTSLVGTVLADTEAIAAYSTATTIPFALGFIPSMIVIYITPYFVKHANDRRWVIKSWLACTLVVGVISIVICVPCLAFADWLIPFVFGEKYADSIDSFRILMIAFVVGSSFRVVAGNILATHRRYFFNLLSNLASLLICTWASFFLIFAMGIEGAAIGYLISMVCGSVINVGGVLFFSGKPRVAGYE